MFFIVGTDTIARYNRGPVPLISINCRGSYAGVRVDTREYEGIRLKGREKLFELGSEESAVSLFHDDRIGWCHW